MKFSTNLCYLTCASLFTASVLGNDDIFVKVMIPEAEILTNEDVVAIEQAKDNSIVRRNLRSERRLDPAWCDEVCKEFPFPNCQIWQRQCTDHRRRTAEDKRHERRLPDESAYEVVKVTGSECDAKKASVMEALEAAVTTEGSRNVVDRSVMTCHTIVEVCRVTGFDLWNADTNSKVRSGIHEDSLICNGDYNFSIAAVTDACVESVTFRLQGPGGFDYIHTEQDQPYFLFRNSHGIDSIFDRRPSFGGFENGAYTLTVMPDSDTSQEKQLHFNLATC